MRARLLGLAALAAVLPACSVSGTRDALESLKSDAFSPKYHSGFWAEEASRRSPLWNEAAQICAAQDASPNPNCRVVLAVDLTVRIIAIRQDDDLDERLRAWIQGGTRELGLPTPGSMPAATKGFGPETPKMPTPAGK
jgi:hypothetical protein